MGKLFHAFARRFKSTFLRFFDLGVYKLQLAPSLLPPEIKLNLLIKLDGL